VRPRNRGRELAHYAANQWPEDGLVRNDTCYAGRFRPSRLNPHPLCSSALGANMTTQRALHPWPSLYEMHTCQREAHGPRPQTRPAAELMSTSGVPTLLLRRRDRRHPQEAEVRLRYLERRRCRAQDRAGRRSRYNLPAERPEAWKLILPCPEDDIQEPQQPEAVRRFFVTRENGC
jgi:hypothetical protein